MFKIYSLTAGLLPICRRVPSQCTWRNSDERCVKGAIRQSAFSMNWCKVQAVVYSAETSPGCEGMLVSGAEA